MSGARAEGAQVVGGAQIDIQRLSKTYVTADGTVAALQDATFSVKAGAARARS